MKIYQIHRSPQGAKVLTQQVTFLSANVEVPGSNPSAPLFWNSNHLYREYYSFFGPTKFWSNGSPLLLQTIFLVSSLSTLSFAPPRISKKSQFWVFDCGVSFLAKKMLIPKSTKSVGGPTPTSLMSFARFRYPGGAPRNPHFSTSHHTQRSNLIQFTAENGGICTSSLIVH